MQRGRGQERGPGTAMRCTPDLLAEPAELSFFQGTAIAWKGLAD